MRITLEVPDNRAEFMLELLRSLPFVVLLEETTEAEQDTTEYLLASSANAAHLQQSLKQPRRGERRDCDKLKGSRCALPSQVEISAISC
jgi:hypothetical protein